MRRKNAHTHTHTKLATIWRQETLDTKGMIASWFGWCLRGRGRCRVNDRWVKQLDWEMPDDPVIRRWRRHGLFYMLLLLKNVQLEKRLVEMLRVILVGDIDVSDDVHIDIVGAVAAHGRIITGWVTGVHSGHQIAAGSVVSCTARTTATSQIELASVFASAGWLTRQFVTMLSLPLGS